MNNIQTDLLIGLEHGEAKRLIEKAGGTSRVVSRDGCSLIITRDYRTDRMNLHLINNVVDNFSIG